MLSYDFLHSRIHSELTLKSESAGSIQPFPFLFHFSDIQVSIFPAISLPFPPTPTQALFTLVSVTTFSD